MDELIKTKRHKIEGYNLFRERKVVSMKSAISGDYVYFTGNVVPSMRPNRYSYTICFKDKRGALKWAKCTCPAGMDGECKHIVCVLYYLLDITKAGLTEIPDTSTCTDQLQMWHVKRPATDEPLLVSDMQFVRHKPDTSMQRQTLGCIVQQHNPVPSFATAVKSKDVNKLVRLYSAIGMNIPVIETIASNNSVFL